MRCGVISPSTGCLRRRHGTPRQARGGGGGKQRPAGRGHRAVSDAAGPHRCPRQEDHRARPQDPGTCAHRHGAPPREHPGIGPISAVALEALAPPAETFAKAATSRPGSVSPLGRTPRAAGRAWERRRRWDNATCDGYSSSAPRLSCNGPCARALRLDHRSHECWPESRACLSQLRWRTGWLASLGH
jgi:hypothetical protein